MKDEAIIREGWPKNTLRRFAAESLWRGVDQRRQIGGLYACGFGILLAIWAVVSGVSQSLPGPFTTLRTFWRSCWPIRFTTTGRTTKASASARQLDRARVCGLRARVVGSDPGRGADGRELDVSEAVQSARAIAAAGLAAGVVPDRSGGLQARGRSDDLRHLHHLALADAHQYRVRRRRRCRTTTRTSRARSRFRKSRYLRRILIPFALPHILTGLAAEPRRRLARDRRGRNAVGRHRHRIFRLGQLERAQSGTRDVGDYA